MDNSQQTTQKNTADIPPEIKEYLEGLIKEANIPTYDDISKQNIMLELFDRLDKFIAAKIVENLTDEDSETFTKMNEDGKSQEEIDSFIREHLPNAQEVFARAFLDFRDFYLTAQPNFQKAQQAGNPI